MDHQAYPSMKPHDLQLMEKLQITYTSLIVIVTLCCVMLCYVSYVVSLKVI